MDEAFTKEELQNICIRAENESDRTTIPELDQAYRDLADAADKLDSMK